MEDRRRVEIRAWDEHELVRRCRAGSEAAYAELVRRFRPRLYGIAFRLTGSPEAAEDVVQEAFLAAFRAIDRIEPKPSLGAWLTTVTVRLAGRAATRRNADPKASLDAIAGTEGDPIVVERIAAASPDQDPHGAAETAELRRTLADAIAELPFKYRAAVVLRHVVGLEYAEAAHALDVPLNTYKSHLLRGTRMLRDRLGPWVAEGEPIPSADVDAGDGRGEPAEMFGPETRPYAAAVSPAIPRRPERTTAVED